MLVLSGDELRKDVELQPGKRLKKEVEHWLENVETIKDKEQSIENEYKRREYFKRTSLRERVVEVIGEVEELYQKGSFSDGLVLNAPKRKGDMLPPIKLVSETTITKKVEELWDLLMNDEIRLIGLYGMGGCW
ncbi:hypothetical protein L1049_017463 [Liquidambar formosana]|uniref:Uncharacterized protein n=1 Tax=Liquidambar formosana TaxID=63359 RepID=A0AAP0S7H9_LIQFO